MGKSIDAQVMKFRAQLIERYGLLFRRRRLACRKCLAMRYGAVHRPNVRVPCPGILRSTTSKRPDEGESDAAREQPLREAERRRWRREQNREWRRVMKEGMPRVEEALEAIARMRRVERFIALRERCDATSGSGRAR